MRAETIRRMRLGWTVAGAALLLLTVCGWGYLVTAPRYKRMLADRERIEVLGDVLRDAEATRRRFASVQSAARASEQSFATFRKRIPTQSDEAGFLQWLSEAASACGLEVKEFRPVGREQQGELDGRALRIASVGSYESVCRFLDGLRSCPRLNRVSSFEISPRDASREAFTLNLQVVVYSQVDKG